MKKLLFIVLLFSMSYSQISSQISSRTFTGEFPVTINGGNFKPGVYYVYPESCDFEFTILLASKNARPTYLAFNPDRYEKVKDLQYHGETIPETDL